jgi:hypothetical protein
MKTDLYSKIILTVIAVALVWIGVQLTPAASAEQEILKVDIVRIDGRDIGPFSKPLPVEIKGK